MNREQMQEIDALMNEGNAGQFASLVTHTRVGILKPCGKIVRGTTRALKDGEREVTKKSEFVTQAKTSYFKRASAKAESQGEAFELKPRTWGERITPNLVEHKGNLYLETIHNPESKIAKPKTVYYVDGQEVDAESLELPKARPSASGIEVRTFKAGSIRQIKLGGKTIAA